MTCTFLMRGLGWALLSASTGIALSACGEPASSNSMSTPGNTAGSNQGGTQGASSGAGGSSQGGEQTGSGGTSVAAGGSSSGGSTAGGGPATGGSSSGGSNGSSASCAVGEGIALYTDSSTAPTLSYATHGTFAQKSDGSCEGSNYIQYDYAVQSYYDGFKLDLPGSVDATGAAGLSFAYKLGPDDPNFYFIRVITGGGACAAGCDVEYHASAPDWTVVSIPMSKFADSGEVDMSDVVGLEFGFSGPDATGTLLLDNIVFTD